MRKNADTGILRDWKPIWSYTQTDVREEAARYEGFLLFSLKETCVSFIFFDLYLAVTLSASAAKLSRSTDTL